MTQATATEFNRNPNKVKKAAAHGAVFITDKGVPTHVLLTYDDYVQSQHASVSVLEALAHPASQDIELPDVRRKDVPQPVEL